MYGRIEQSFFGEMAEVMIAPVSERFALPASAIASATAAVVGAWSFEDEEVLKMFGAFEFT